MRKRWHHFQRYVRSVTRRPLVARGYFITSILVLLTSTVAWAWVGSYIQLGNADQLANTFIAQHLSTALLPDQHTFLLKLPFFWLVNMLGATPFAFCFVTILVTVLTVGLFALILYRIERRPLYIGTIFLALALVLMMIPAQSFAGANLPVNMAMLTTRNLEYIVYIAGLILIVTAKRWRSARLAWALPVMIILFASDKLFLSVSIGASVLMLMAFIFWKQALLRRVALRWFAVSLVSAVGATLLLLVLSSLGWVHSAGQGSVGPYGLVTNIKFFTQAIIYSVFSVMTNFGANAGYDGRTIFSVFTLSFSRLAGPLIIAYVMTLGILVGVVIATIRVIKLEFKKLTIKKKEVPLHFGLTVTLVASTITAIGLYIISNHYFPVDERYVAISLFAGFVGITSYGKSLRKFYRGRLLTTGLVLIVGIGVSTLFLANSLQQQQHATQDIDHRNALVAQALNLHPADTLLGDYWRVMPIKLGSINSHQTIDPLTDCTTPRGVLNNTAWSAGDTSKSFAYLLTLGPGSQNFSTCTIDQVTKAYGRPDSSVVIAGTERSPQELLLYYDKGIHKPSTTANLTGTVIPAPLSALPFTTCGNETVMTIVAHEDDDILFMNPNLSNEIKAGNCVRTVYMTAGDAGSDGPYWLGRQKGAEAAYNTMLGLTNPVWTERRINLSPTETITVANPRGVHTISLIFLHLPDGSPTGQGYAHSNYESLMKLYTGRIASISTVDKTSSYSSDELISALQSLISVYQPAKLQSQSIQNGGLYLDHSDHTAVGHFVQKALVGVSQPPVATYYLGYPIHGMPENVSGDDFMTKANIFLSFSQFDGATCHSIDECDSSSVYGFYLRRQYTAQE